MEDHRWEPWRYPAQMPAFCTKNAAWNAPTFYSSDNWGPVVHKGFCNPWAECSHSIGYQFSGYDTIVLTPTLASKLLKLVGTTPFLTIYLDRCKWFNYIPKIVPSCAIVPVEKRVFSDMLLAGAPELTKHSREPCGTRRIRGIRCYRVRCLRSVLCTSL